MKMEKGFAVMNGSLKRYLTTGIVCLAACLCWSCFKDKGNYDYKATNNLTFFSTTEMNYAFLVGDEVVIEAPFSLENPDVDIAETFDVEWYLDGEFFCNDPVFRHTFDVAGTHGLILKVTNRQSGERFISQEYGLTIENSFDWGWMVLLDRGDGNSAISFITPDLKPLHNLETTIEGGLGTEPRGIFYYYVNGSIPGSYVSGLPKIIINQGSGTVTLDGRTLQKDMWLRDEFENGQEPENLFMDTFVFKGRFYLIHDREGDTFMRAVTGDYTNEYVPYYGKYSAQSVELAGGKITCLAPFTNVSYANGFVPESADKCLGYDGVNGCFYAFVEGPYIKDDPANSYRAVAVKLWKYDENCVVPSGQRPIDALGTATRCLAISAYQMCDVSEVGGIYPYGDYVALLDLDGAGSYYIYSFAVKNLTYGNHLIASTSQVPFAGADLLTDRSVILFSSDFNTNRYSYFTDGEKNLYVYDIRTNTYKLAYTASSPIRKICASPIQCPFKDYGGHSEYPNWRLALGLENGTITVIDVAETKMVSLFEGFQPQLELASFEGFGDIKGIVWCTNYEGEY